jgi:hypothetical protein
MRVLWLAPRFRSLANIYGRGLVAEGHEVQIITTSKHPEPAPSLVEELVCPKRPYDPRWAVSFAEAERIYRHFKPHVVISDEITDPVFALLAQGMRPEWLVVHDAQPHDQTYELHGLRKAIQAVGWRRPSHILTFSEHVAREVKLAEGSRHSAEVHNVKLLSDVIDEDVPRFRSRNERHDFVLMGRVAPYKNVCHVLRAWEVHVNSSHYRGDRLIVWGAGQGQLTESTVENAHGDSTVEWRREVYRYSDIRDGRFSGFKGSLCVYSEASQSGVQILSAQLGVVPIVSNVGGLPEYQAPTLPVLDPADREGLVAVLNRVADPDTATELGQIARDSYFSLNSQGVVTKELATLLAHSILQR